MKSLKTFKTFEDFWPYYLQEHSNLQNRRLHFVGTFLIHLVFFYVFATADFKMLWFVPLVGYSFAWFGHFVIEKNRPATFKHPLWSLIGDFKMFYTTILKKL